MSMTQRDFEAIAHVIEQEFSACQDIPAAAMACRATAIGIASHCANVNPAFNRVRFMTACGMRAND